MSHRLKIAPSILAADFTRLGEQVREAEAAGADCIHVDAMDGQFVPTISFGPLIAEAVRRSTSLPIDLHAMIVEPERQVQAFRDAGADTLTIHAESSVHLHRVVHAIKSAGMRAGIALNPATPLEQVRWILPDLDLLLIMSINPGWGGQRFLPLATAKLREARALVATLRLTTEIEVDGGIDEHTVGDAVAAGATVLVAGSAIFGAKDGVRAATARLRTAIDAADPSLV
ncbi:MAG: ribulose-phosphate 3-epimerase [Dehalococcoidia bacterium]